MVWNWKEMQSDQLCPTSSQEKAFINFLAGWRLLNKSGKRSFSSDKPAKDLIAYFAHILVQHFSSSEVNVYFPEHSFWSPESRNIFKIWKFTLEVIPGSIFVLWGSLVLPRCLLPAKIQDPLYCPRPDQTGPLYDVFDLWNHNFLKAWYTLNTSSRGYF